MFFEYDCAVIILEIQDTVEERWLSLSGSTADEYGEFELSLDCLEAPTPIPSPAPTPVPSIIPTDQPTGLPTPQPSSAAAHLLSQLLHRAKAQRL